MCQLNVIPSFLLSLVNSGGKIALTEEFSQVYSLADGIRIWMVRLSFP
jgi:hypothetical protein